MSNQEVVKILSEISAILAMDEVPFKPQAFERAAYSIQSLGEGLDEIYKKGGLKALEEIPGVGASIAEANAANIAVFTADIANLSPSGKVVAADWETWRRSRPGSPGPCR